MSALALTKLTQTYALAAKLMDEYGLTEDGWTFDFSSQARRVGECKFDDKVLRYSLHYVTETSMEEVEDTIRHEIAHALAGWEKINGRYVYHGDHWKRIARQVGARPQACTSLAVSTKKPNYHIYCTACGKVTSKKYRLRQELLTRYISKCCGAKLDAERL